MKNAVLSTILLILTVSAGESQSLTRVLAAPAPAGSTPAARVLHPEKYLLLNQRWSRAGGKPDALIFQVFSAEKKAVQDLRVDLRALGAAFGNALKGGTDPFLDFVYFDGRIAGFYARNMIMNFQKPDDSPDRTHTYAYILLYDTVSGQWSDLKQVGDFDARYTQSAIDGGEKSIHLIGYQTSSSYPQNLKVKFTRVRLPQLTLEEKSFDLPPLQEGNDFRFFLTPDERYFVASEYAEMGVGNQNPVMVLFGLDAPDKIQIPIPLTAYGVFYDPVGRMLLGSNQLWQTWAVDLKTRKVTQKEPCIGNVQYFIPSLDGKKFLILANTILANPKGVEVRDVSTLKLAKLIPINLLYPGINGIHPDGAVYTRSGRFLLLPKFEASGFPEDGGGQVIFEQIP